MQQGDLSSYIGLLKRRLPAILLISVVATLIAYGVASRFQPKYIVHFSYVVSQVSRDETPDFRFDGYYALSATDLFTTTLASWMTTPEHVVAAYTAAGLPLPTNDAREIVKAVEAKKAGPQLVQVGISDESKVRAEALAQGLQEVVAAQVKTYHSQGTPAVSFRVMADTPWTSLQKLPIRMIVWGTFVFAFLFLLNGALLLESVKRLS
ncbi:MAG: hypothetical protein HYZ62_00940 [Candidatus Andersenbacteria bacterium]|nr:hypothetical protein [Candidatus Andersenbacteria bacterium]